MFYLASSNSQRSAERRNSFALSQSAQRASSEKLLRGRGGQLFFFFFLDPTQGFCGSPFHLLAHPLKMLGLDKRGNSVTEVTPVTSSM